MSIMFILTPSFCKIISIFDNDFTGNLSNIKACKYDGISPGCDWIVLDPFEGLFNEIH